MVFLTSRNVNKDANISMYSTQFTQQKTNLVITEIIK